MKKIFFVSGLPRSGSTLLMNILGQNPNNYVTPTSGLIEICVNTRNFWRNVMEFQAEGLDNVMPRVQSAIKGMIYGYFDKEEGNVVFDKSRGWLHYIEFLEEVLETQIKVIVPIRDVRAICASFERIYRSKKIDYIEGKGEAYYNQQTVYGRTRLLLNDQNVVGVSINRFRDAFFHRGIADRLIVIPYRILTTKPQDVMTDLHGMLDLEPFDYDFDNVQQITKEDDRIHGMDLHKIKSKVEPQESVPWEGILPNDLVQEIESNYKDINNIC